MKYIGRLIFIMLTFSLMNLNNLQALNFNGISSLSKINEIGGVDFKEQNIEILQDNFNNNEDAYNKFIKDNGFWNFSINKFNGMPIKAFGKPILIEGYNAINSSNIEQASRDFISTKLSSFGINNAEIKLIRAEYYDNKWFVSFNQYFNNLEVFNSKIDLRISNDAKVFSFGIAYFGNLANIIDFNKINSSQINPLKNAFIGLEDFGKIITNSIQNVNTEKIIPIPTKSGYSFKVAYEVPFKTEDELFEFVSYVDKLSGDLLYRHTNHRDANASVTNKGTIKFKNPMEKDTLVYFGEMKNFFGTDSAITNSQGKIVEDLTKSVTFKSIFSGPWVKVTRLNSSNLFDTKTANYTSIINPGDNLIVNWNDTISMKGERTLFWHANFIHSYYKKLDPKFTGMDSVLNLQISFTGSANAFSGGSTIRFTGCQDANFKLYESGAVLYHEWGHSVNSFLYKSLGSAQGMINASCNEGTADVTSCMMLDDFFVGRGVKPADPNFNIRNLKNKIIYPDSLTNESHHDGQILAGAYWDLRDLTNADFVMKLSHKAKYGKPDDLNVGIAFSEWFIETLIADDDDNDLSNGTPYYDKIVESFNNHHIGTNLFTKMSFQHTPLSDTKDTINDYIANFNIDYLPLPNAKPSPVKLIYMINNLKILNEVVATETEKGKYTAKIPAQPNGTVVKYYFTAYDKLSSVNLVLSASQTETKPFLFTVGYETIYMDDFETTNNWKIGDSTDIATYGKWEIATPNVITLSIGQIQPGSGTGEGTKCLVTGALGNSNNYYSYYPNGTTSVISKSFNLSNTPNPILKFNKWFYNYYNLTTIPAFEFYISEDDGKTWKTIETSIKKTSQWESQLYNLNDYVNDFAKLKFKFVVRIAKSSYITWVTEALIDDFEILSPIQGISSVNDVESKFNVNISPNPSFGQIKINITPKDGSEIPIIEAINAYNEAGELLFSNNSMEISNLKLKDNGVIIFNIKIKNYGTITKKIINY